MARIPSYTQVVTPFQGIDMPQGAFNRTGQAVGALISSVGGALDTVKHFVDEAQNIRNDSDVRERARQMRTLQAKFNEEIMSNKIDPAQWTTEWEKRLASFESTLSEKNGMSVPPVVLRTVQEQFKEFSGQSLLSISANALKENRRQATGFLELDIKDDVGVENFDGAIEKIKHGVATGLYTQLDGAAQIQAIEGQKKQSAMEQIMRDDPQGLIDKLGAGEYDSEYSPNQRGELMDKARSEKVRREKNAMANLQYGIASGYYKNEQELEKDLENDYPDISPALRKAVLANFRGVKPMSFEEKNAITDPVVKGMKDFADGKINMEEFGRIHDNAQSIVLANEGREGLGALKSFLYTADPTSLRSTDLEKAREQIKKATETPRAIGIELIKDNYTAMSGIATAGEASAVDEYGLSTWSKKELATKVGNRLVFGNLYRAAMERELDRFLNQAGDKTPSVEDVRMHIAKSQPTVLRDVLARVKEAAKKPYTHDTLSPSSKVGMTAAEKARKEAEDKANAIINGVDTLPNPIDGSPMMLPPPQ